MSTRSGRSSTGRRRRGITPRRRRRSRAPSGCGRRRDRSLGLDPVRGRPTEELDDVSDLREALGAQGLLDRLNGAPQLDHRRLVELLDVVRLPAHHVIAVRVAQVDLVKACPVYKERPADESDRLKGGHAAVNGHNVAGIRTQLTVQGVYAGRAARLDERRKYRHAGLRDPQAGFLQFVTGELDGGLFLARYAGKGMVGLG